MNVKKRIFSMLLAALMVLTIFPLQTDAYAATEPTHSTQMLCMGDSMTYNIAARHNWLYDIENFGYYAADVLGYKYTASNLQLPGGRSTDLLACISDYYTDEAGNRIYYYNGDDYSADKLTLRFDNQTVGEIREAYINDIRNAGVITLNSGYSNTTAFYVQYLRQLFSGEVKWDLNMRDLVYDDEACLYDAVVSAVEKGIGEARLERIRNLLSGTLLDKFNKAIYGFEYMILAELLSFDRLVARIYEINPDVDIYVLEMFNPVEYANLSIRIPTLCGPGSIQIPIGKVLGNIFKLFNKYHSKLSMYHDQYTYVRKNNRSTFSLSATESLQGAEELLNCVIRDSVRDGDMLHLTNAQHIVFELWYNGKDVSRLLPPQEITEQLLDSLLGHDHNTLVNVNDVRNFVGFYLNNGTNNIATNAAQQIKDDYQNCQALIEMLLDPSNPISRLNDHAYIQKLALGLQKIFEERTICLNDAVLSLLQDGISAYSDALDPTELDVTTMFCDGSDGTHKGIFYIFEQAATEDGYRKLSFTDRSVAHLFAFSAANVTSVHPDSKCNVAIAEDLIESYYSNHPDERPVTVA